MLKDVLILGCGFTGSRVAERLRARGVQVLGIRSSDIDFTRPGWEDALRRIARPGCVVLHSVPTLAGEADRKLLEVVEGRPSRVVYLSTTGVYGRARVVNERTPIAPEAVRERLRAATEAAVLGGSWHALVLRPAAIYGSGRGVHVAMQQGRYILAGDGSNFISRIHVDDLAAVTEAALRSDLTGAFPVADAYPCASREIAEYCAELLGLPPPASGPLENVPESRRTDRRVDGSAILRELGVELLYPSYREGIPASLAAVQVE